MKKPIIAIISALLAAILLVGCTPAGGFVPKDTTKPILGPSIPTGDGTVTINDYVVRSTNYYFGEGEYYYFFADLFQQFTASLTEEQLSSVDLKLEPGESLRDKMHPNGGSWFEYFRDISLEYMTDILSVCEAAISADPYITNEAQLHFNEQYKKPMTEQAKQDESVGSFENLILSLYGGAVSANEYSNAIQKEYIYEVYCNETRESLKRSLTDIDAELFAESEAFKGEKDESLSRNVAYIEVELRDAEYNKSVSEQLIAQYNAGEKTAAALEAIADSEKLYFGKQENITKGSSSVAAEWLFVEARKLGDGGVIRLGENSPIYAAVVYYGDGKPTYLLDALDQLAQKQVDEQIDRLVSGAEIAVDQEKLNTINA